MVQHNHITKAIIGAAIEVHKTLGPGLLQSSYKERLKSEMLLRNLPSTESNALRGVIKTSRIFLGLLSEF
ncbi:MAG: GxxExxY protein [Pyrinomonadaceae bacterium]